MLPDKAWEDMIDRATIEDLESALAAALAERDEARRERDEALAALYIRTPCHPDLGIARSAALAVAMAKTSPNREMYARLVADAMTESWISPPAPPAREGGE